MDLKKYHFPAISDLDGDEYVMGKHIMVSGVKSTSESEVTSIVEPQTQLKCHFVVTKTVVRQRFG